VQTAFGSVLIVLVDGLQAEECEAERLNDGKDHLNPNRRDRLLSHQVFQSRRHEEHDTRSDDAHALGDDVELGAAVICAQEVCLGVSFTRGYVELRFCAAPDSQEEAV